MEYARKLVHPHMLKVLSATDTNQTSPTEGSLILVTESAVPLNIWLRDNEDNLTTQDVTLGLMGLLEAVKFANSNGIIVNLPVNGDGIYVTKGGEFKVRAESEGRKTGKQKKTKTSERR